MGSILREAVAEASRSGLAEGPPERDSAERLAELAARLAREEGSESLAAAFRGAVRDLASRIDRVSLAVTGLGWLGGGVPAVERTVVELMGTAEREIMLTIYSMTPGSGRVQSALEDVLSSGIRCTLLVNRIEDQHPEIRALLERLARLFPETLSVNDFVAETIEGLHAKIVVVDRRVALVGSPNLSFRGLSAAHELAVVVAGPTAETIGERVDMLLRSHFVHRFPA